MGMSTRADSAGRPVEIGKTTLTQKTSVSDSIHLWNRAPIKVTGCVTIAQVKKEIRNYVKQLPV